jgi:hypothetical protein
MSFREEFLITNFISTINWNLYSNLRLKHKNTHQLKSRSIKWSIAVKTYGFSSLPFARIDYKVKSNEFLI